MAHTSGRPPGSAYPSTRTPTCTHACLSVACAESPGGMIFAGKVLSVQRVPARNLRDLETVEISFHVETAIRGVRTGQTLRIREWAGLWVARPRCRIGERVVLFLYPLSLLGLTSPVADGRGRFLVTPAGRVRLCPAQRLWLATEDTSLEDRIPDGISLTSFLQKLRSGRRRAAMRRRPVLLRRLLFATLLILLVAFARAGGPKYVVGSSFFTAAAPGQPVTWANGTLTYYTYQGNLSQFWLARTQMRSLPTPLHVGLRLHQSR